MNRKILVSAAVALIALCFGLSNLVPARGNSGAKAVDVSVIAGAVPAPTPKKREIPIGDSTDMIKPPAGLKGTIKFNPTGNQTGALSCNEIEVIINKASQTIAKVNASGNFMSGKCSFNFTALPADTPLALLVPEPNWKATGKCSQLQFDNQAVAVPALKPGITKPVILTIKTLNCVVPK